MSTMLIQTTRKTKKVIKVRTVMRSRPNVHIVEKFVLLTLTRAMLRKVSCDEKGHVKTSCLKHSCGIKSMDAKTVKVGKCIVEEAEDLIILYFYSSVARKELRSSSFTSSFKSFYKYIIWTWSEFRIGANLRMGPIWVWGQFGAGTNL